MAIKIKFCGGVRTVTGSSHLIETKRARVLIDAGVFYGKRDEFYNLNSSFAYKPNQIDALLLSHAHLDHSGNIPNLIKNGLRCKIYTTGATKDICELMLEDSGKVQEEDIRYLNKINKKLGLPQRKPLYTEKEGRNAVKKFRSLFYNQSIKVARDIHANFIDAGHILGSGIIVVDIKEDYKDRIRLAYAVDLGRKNLPLLNDPEIPKNIDYLVLESTYGGRFHAPIEEAKSKLADTINRTIQRGGKVIIPSFALERAQEIIYFLNLLIKEKAIPTIPIYVDSPLAIDVTAVFKQHLRYLDSETQYAIENKQNPFESVHINYVRSQDESKRLNIDRRPMIIIAGSGMCESGRILHHLKNNIEDTRNTVLVVGYMAQNTLGKRIVDKEKFVRIYGIECELNAEVVVINSFSGHADQNELVDFAQSCGHLKRIFVVHGDEDQSLKLTQKLSSLGLETYLPSKNEEVELS